MGELCGTLERGTQSEKGTQFGYVAQNVSMIGGVSML